MGSSQRGATWHPTPTGSMGAMAMGAELLLFHTPHSDQIHHHQPPPPLLTWMKFKISLNKAKTGSPASGGPPAEQPSSARARPRSARTTSLLLPFVNSSAAPTGGELAAHFFYTRRADCGRSVFLELVLCHELGPCSGD